MKRREEKQRTKHFLIKLFEPMFVGKFQIMSFPSFISLLCLVLCWEGVRSGVGNLWVIFIDAQD
jgi:hypothetical protein